MMPLIMRKLSLKQQKKAVLTLFLLLQLTSQVSYMYVCIYPTIQEGPFQLKWLQVSLNNRSFAFRLVRVEGSLGKGKAERASIAMASGCVSVMS